MRGYCPKCKEYRSDNGTDAWSILWSNASPICERCSSFVDVWPNSKRGVSNKSSKKKRSKENSYDERGQSYRDSSLLSLERSAISDNTTSTWMGAFYEQRYPEC